MLGNFGRRVGYFLAVFSVLLADFRLVLGNFWGGAKPRKMYTPRAGNVHLAGGLLGNILALLGNFLGLILGR